MWRRAASKSYGARPQPLPFGVLDERGVGRAVGRGVGLGFGHARRSSSYVDLWSGREDWLCLSGWEDGGPVGYAHGSRFKPGGWWKGSDRPRDVRGRIFALSELMAMPQWQGPAGPSTSTTR